MSLSKVYSLMLITQRNQRPMHEYLQFIKRCAGAGLTSVQLREKEISGTQTVSQNFLYEFGARLKDILDPKGVALVINDHLELALKLDATVLHMGQTDGCPKTAREKLGPQKILGISIENFDDQTSDDLSMLDYVSAGAVFPTRHKTNLKRIWGLEGLSELSQRSRHPMIAIGGITLNNAEDILRAGAVGFALSGAIQNAENPEKVTQQLRDLVDSYTPGKSRKLGFK